MVEWNMIAEINGRSFYVTRTAGCINAWWDRLGQARKSQNSNRFPLKSSLIFQSLISFIKLIRAKKYNNNTTMNTTQESIDQAY